MYVDIFDGAIRQVEPQKLLKLFGEQLYEAKLHKEADSKKPF